MANTTRPPMQEKVRNVWSPRDEAALSDLVARRERIMREAREPLVTLVATLPVGSSSQDELLIDWMIENAEGLRDALDPFDSHVRAG